MYSWVGLYGDHITYGDVAVVTDVGSFGGFAL
jgi:hypothetical protein